MSYTFAKIRNKGKENDKGYWYLLADSINTIKEHFNTYGKSYFKEGVNAYMDWCKKGKTGHYVHKFPYIVEVTAQLPENQGLPWVVVATKVENLMLQSRIELFNKGTKFYLNKEMVVLVDSPILEITNVIVKGTMVYPDDEEMTAKDARYIQWGNGIHWYAKVGKFDVVDKDNNQKWNTKKEAQEATKWFIANYNN